MSFLVAHEPAIRLAGFVSIFLILAILEVLLEARPLRLARSIRWRRNLGIDVSLGTRFHPLEMVLSMGIKFGAVAVLGAPVIAVVLFELMLNLSSLFTHANVLLPSGLDSMLRRVIVTPPMHRVHHSSHLQQATQSRHRRTRTSASACRFGTGFSAPTSWSRTPSARLTSG